ncbi:MAG: hypothetical protein PUC12_01510, partial [Clostridiales bacterium]|nr:hypothetical protein [Clostridiales bacterium]
KVEVKQGTKQIGETEETNFVEVKEGEENTVLVDLDMPVFDNVETYEITVGDTVSGSGDNSGTDTQKKKVSKMAPGVYGSLTIRLTPLSKEINCYEITPEAMFKYIDAVNAVVLEDGTTSNVQVDSNVQIMEELAKGHILFFKERVAISNSSDGKIMIADNTVDITTHTHNQKYVFVDQISSDKPMIGNLTWNTENNTGNSTEVTLYWYWPYEYNNLSSDIQDSIKLDRSISPTSAENDPRRNYFDMDKMQEIENKSASWNETQLYDYADTRIGTYVKSIQLHLEVKGYHATEQTPSGE